MIKLRNGYVRREVAGQHVVVPTGEAAIDFSGVITLNGVGAFLWQRLEEGRTEQELLAEMLESYIVQEDVARTDLTAFLDRLRAADLLEA